MFKFTSLVNGKSRRRQGKNKRLVPDSEEPLETIINK